jgi:general stress protein YciG
LSIKDRGFASMDAETRRRIAQQGGRAAHLRGRAHRWTPDEASAAGRKGAQVRISRLPGRAAAPPATRPTSRTSLWHVRGTDGRVLQCSLVWGPGPVEVVVSYDGEPILFSGSLTSIEQAGETAALWKEALVANGNFSERVDTPQEVTAAVVAHTGVL